MNALMRDFKRIIHVGLCIIHRDISHNLPIVWLQCPWLSLDTWNNETCAIKLIVLLTWISQSSHLNCQLHSPTKSRNLIVQNLKTIWHLCRWPSLHIYAIRKFFYSSLLQEIQVDQTKWFKLDFKVPMCFVSRQT